MTLNIKSRNTTTKIVSQTLKDSIEKNTATTEKSEEIVCGMLCEIIWRSVSVSFV